MHPASRRGEAMPRPLCFRLGRDRRILRRTALRQKICTLQAIVQVGVQQQLIR